MQLNEEKTIKPAVFLGVLIILTDTFITGTMYVIAYFNHFQLQWFYPDTINEIFLIVFGIGAITFLIGFLPGYK